MSSKAGCEGEKEYVSKESSVECAAAPSSTFTDAALNEESLTPLAAIAGRGDDSLCRFASDGEYFPGVGDSCSNALSSDEDDRKPAAKGSAPSFASPDDDVEADVRTDFGYSEEDYLQCIGRYIRNPGLRFLFCLSNKKPDDDSENTTEESASASAITAAQLDTSRTIFVHE